MNYSGSGGLQTAGFLGGRFESAPPWDGGLETAVPWFRSVL